MSYEIKISENQKYVILKNTGNITRKSVMQRIIEAHQVGHKNNINNYLMDLSEAINNDSIANNYDFAYNDMKENTNVDAHACVAFLVAENDHTHDFIETVMVNAGYEIKLFRDKEKAIEFLMKNS